MGKSVSKNITLTKKWIILMYLFKYIQHYYYENVLSPKDVFIWIINVEIYSHFIIAFLMLLYHVKLK